MTSVEPSVTAYVRFDLPPVISVASSGPESRPGRSLSSQVARASVSRPSTAVMECSQSLGPPAT